MYRVKADSQLRNVQLYMRENRDYRKPKLNDTLEEAEDKFRLFVSTSHFPPDVVLSSQFSFFCVSFFRAASKGIRHVFGVFRRFAGLHEQRPAPNRHRVDKSKNADVPGATQRDGDRQQPLLAQQTSQPYAAADSSSNDPYRLSMDRQRSRAPYHG